MKAKRLILYSSLAAILFFLIPIFGIALTILLPIAVDSTVFVAEDLELEGVLSASWLETRQQTGVSISQGMKTLFYSLPRGTSEVAENTQRYEILLPDCQTRAEIVVTGIKSKSSHRGLYKAPVKTQQARQLASENACN